MQMIKQKSRWVFLVIALWCAIHLSGCSFTGVKDGEITDTRPNDAESITATLPDGFNEIYREAERVYALFTGYRSDIYTTAVYGENDVQYRAVDIAGCTTLSQLRALCEQYFDPKLTDELMAKTVMDQYPLFAEYQGQLCRFDGYVAMFGYDAGENDQMTLRSVENGSYTVAVSTVMLENDREIFAEILCTYTIAEDGGIRFTSFPLMADALYREMYI